jgi:hypothetical protein
MEPLRGCALRDRGNDSQGRLYGIHYAFDVHSPDVTWNVRLPCQSQNP